MDEVLYFEKFDWWKHYVEERKKRKHRRVSSLGPLKWGMRPIGGHLYWTVRIIDGMPRDFTAYTDGINAHNIDVNTLHALKGFDPREWAYKLVENRIV